MSVCPVCTAENADSAKFCSTCGSALSEAQNPSTIAARRPGDHAQPTASESRRPTVSAQLGSANVSVDPGREATVTIRVRNSGEIVDELTITITGPAAAWTDVEPDAVRLMPGTEGEATIRFAPPADGTVLAGSVPFTIRVASRELAGEIADEPGAIAIGSVRSLTTAIVPSTARSSRAATYAVDIECKGNAPVDVTLAASDPDEALDLRLNRDRAHLEAGGRERVQLVVAPRRRFWLGNAEHRPFRIDVTARELPPATATATFVQQAILPRWAPTLVGAVLAVALLGGAAYGLGIVRPGSTVPPLESDAVSPVVSLTPTATATATATVTLEPTVTEPPVTPPPPPPAFGVTEIFVLAGPNAYGGPCPTRIDFTAYITVDNGPGTVTYRWIRSDGATGPEATVNFDGPGTQEVADDWTLGGSGTSYDGWETIEIIDPTPGPADVPKGFFKINCS